MGTRGRTSSRRFGQDRIALAWFDAQEYARILEIMLYPPDMSRDYNRWRELHENKQRSLERSGRFVVPVVVNPDELVAWCEAHAIAPNNGGLNGFLYAKSGIL